MRAKTPELEILRRKKISETMKNIHRPHLIRPRPEKRTGYITKCKICDKQFRTIPSVNQKYCSKDCLGKANSIRMKGKRPDWLAKPETVSKLYKGISSKEKLERMRFQRIVQKQIFNRDDYTCVVCQQHGGHLQVDHIKPWAKFPELRFDMDNCRTLCMACHYYVTFKRKMPKGMIWGHNLKWGIAS